MKIVESVGQADVVAKSGALFRWVDDKGALSYMRSDVAIGISFPPRLPHYIILNFRLG